MARITQIKPQKNRKRFNIYLDNQFAFGLSAEALTRSSLKLNQELSEKDVQDLVFENEFQKLYDQALRLLSYRLRSEKEISHRLKKKILQEKLVVRVVERLKKEGLINDADFALWWCQQRASFRPRGKLMILAELRQKGVGEKLARETVEKVINEKILAQKAAEKKMKAFKKLSSKDQRQKLGQFMAGRGFSWSVIKEVIDSFLKKG
jgi:regulatory protein